MDKLYDRLGNGMIKVINKVSETAPDAVLTFIINCNVLD